MTNPILVEVTRGDRVESHHRGAFAIVDEANRLVASVGDIERPIFPRSAVKILQALPLVENGWADRFGLSDAELALACASHAGEPIHVETATRLLARVGLDAASLECGAHWPSSKRAARQLLREGSEPSPLHNNCSGKHGGFLCAACALEAVPTGYVNAAHPVQRLVADTLEDLYGCSIPTYAVPLRNLASGFARIGTGTSLGPQRMGAASRLRAAVAAHPELVAGSGRLDTVLARHFAPRVYTKTGAEGVFCASLPELGWGLALKCDDGTTRASEFMLVRLLAAAMGWSEEDESVLKSQLDPVLRNWSGIEVGSIRATPSLSLPQA